ncbi:hypothetical protein EZS27_005979 [termite gut metagenome]|uniref:InsA N-terminal domain-containing protein n=1 Tax=termite gut metagenome TaxID=433724 RepID=A0A5J4SKN3_9ZZZZ
MSCPQYSDTSVKSSFAKGRQRYKCKACGYRFTVSQAFTAGIFDSVAELSRSFAQTPVSVTYA